MIKEIRPYIDDVSLCHPSAWEDLKGENQKCVQGIVQCVQISIISENEKTPCSPDNRRPLFIRPLPLKPQRDYSAQMT